MNDTGVVRLSWMFKVFIWETYVEEDNNFLEKLDFLSANLCYVLLKLFSIAV